MFFIHLQVTELQTYSKQTFKAEHEGEKVHWKPWSMCTSDLISCVVILFHQTACEEWRNHHWETAKPSGGQKIDVIYNVRIRYTKGADALAPEACWENLSVKEQNDYMTIFYPCPGSVSFLVDSCDVWLYLWMWCGLRQHSLCLQVIWIMELSF